LILIFSVNTNHESVAYRSFSPSKFEARGARKVTTGIDRVKPWPVVPFALRPCRAWSAEDFRIGVKAGNMPGCGDPLLMSVVPGTEVIPLCEVLRVGRVIIHWNRGNPQLIWLPGTPHERTPSWTVQRSQRLGFSSSCLGDIAEPNVWATSTCEGAAIIGNSRWLSVFSEHADRSELACGSQAFIATLLFDPSMSALPIIPKQNSVSVGLFTH